MENTLANIPTWKVEDIAHRKGNQNFESRESQVEYLAFPVDQSPFSREALIVF
jgi:hypothetical protein